MSITILGKKFITAQNNTIKKVLKKVEFKNIQQVTKKAEEPKITEQLNAMATSNKVQLFKTINPAKQVEEITAKLTKEKKPFKVIKDSKGTCIVEFHPQTKFPRKTTLIKNNGKIEVKEQVKNNIRHSTGCVVYKVLNDGTLEKMAIIKPYKN